jgi:hypothetical protein
MQFLSYHHSSIWSRKVYLCDIKALQALLPRSLFPALLFIDFHPGAGSQSVGARPQHSLGNL